MKANCKMKSPLDVFLILYTKQFGGLNSVADISLQKTRLDNNPPD